MSKVFVLMVIDFLVTAVFALENSLYSMWLVPHPPFYLCSLSVNHLYLGWGGVVR